MPYPRVEPVTFGLRD
uniref:Uncharacterized protein n=1 Tax=Anguilla anguilla TaxID=7936 RepID=A0A0E9VJU3_ANGAN